MSERTKFVILLIIFIASIILLTILNSSYARFLG